MENNKKPNAYRAIFDDVLEYYSTDVEKIPDLTGEHFKSLGNGRNNFNYDPNKKYLHFFPDLAMARGYAQDLYDEVKKPVSVVAFYFDENLLEKCSYTGQYHTSDYSRLVDEDEYIIPLEMFDAKTNMIEVVEQIKKSDKDSYDPDGYMSGWYM